MRLKLRSPSTYLTIHPSSLGSHTRFCGCRCFVGAGVDSDAGYVVIVAGW